MRVRLLALASLALFAAGCSNDAPGSSTTTPPPACIDGDKDGVDSCSDCDDADPASLPGGKEICDGKDNNCDGRVDEGCAGPDAGQPGTDAGSGSCSAGQTKTCGVANSGCIQRCSGGVFGACQPPAGPVDLQTDPKNCGECGNVCPGPANADAVCTAGRCGRTPCKPGFYDFDGIKTFGCEVSCAAGVCKDSLGNVIPVTNVPLHETGALFRAVSAGASNGGMIQTSSKNTNLATTGQPGVGVMKSSAYENRGGFLAIEKK